QAVADRDLQQLMPGRVKLDLVDPVAKPVVRAQARRIVVGLKAPVDRFLSAGQGPQLVDEVMRPGGAFALERLTERRVGCEQVVVEERRRLIATHLTALRRGAVTPSSGLLPEIRDRDAAVTRLCSTQHSAWISTV